MQHMPLLWDGLRADRLVGATVKARLDIRDPAIPGGREYCNISGVVLIANRDEGVIVRLSGEREGDIFCFPPDLMSCFKPCARDEEGSHYTCDYTLYLYATH